MADWLTGAIESQPGYQPRCGPAPETTGLLDVLATANRSGFLTIGSQPGVDAVGRDGARWQQHAAVEGFVEDPDLLQRLVGAASHASVTIILHELGDRPGSGARVVTTRDDAPVTAFGGALSRRDLRCIWHGCHRDALAAVSRATQVTLIDPSPRPSERLWDLLRRQTAALPGLLKDSPPVGT